jgi:hypothetical protein
MYHKDTHSQSHSSNHKSITVQARETPIGATAVCKVIPVHISRPVINGTVFFNCTNHVCLCSDLHLVHNGVYANDDFKGRTSCLASAGPA